MKENGDNKRVDGKQGEESESTDKKDFNARTRRERARVRDNSGEEGGKEVRRSRDGIINKERSYVVSWKS